MPRLAVRNYSSSIFLLGVGNYINIPYVANMQIGAGSFYNAMWFNAESNRSATPQGTIYQSNGTDSWLNGVLYYANNKAFGLYVSGNLAGGIGSSITGFFSQFGNGWHRLVVVFNSSDWKARVYVDGVLFYTTGAFAPWNVTAVTDTRFGYANLTNNALFQYSDIVLGTGVPTLADVQADYYNNKLLPSATHRYLLTEGSGSTVADSIGGNTGAVNISAGVWQTASPMKSRSANAQLQNLIKSSRDITHASWTTDGTATAATLSGTDHLGNTSTFSRLTAIGGSLQYVRGASYNPAALSGVYTISAWVKTVAGGTQAISMTPSIAVAYSSDLTVTGSWTQVSYTVTVAGNASTTLIRGNAANAAYDIYIDDIQIVRANWAGPRTQTTTTAINTGNIRNTVAQNQNLLTFSEQFDNAAYAKGNITVTANSTTAPDGNVTADTFTDTNDGGLTSHNVDTGSRVSTKGVVNTFSVFVKAGTKSKVALFSDAGTSGATFDLATGLFGQYLNTTPIGSGIVPIGNGWYRVWITFNGLGFATRMYMINALNSSTYTGDGTGTLFFWGAQIVKANWAGQYTQTTTAAVNTGNIRNVATSRNAA